MTVAVVGTGDSSTLYLFATALAVGSASMLLLVPVQQIGRKFFILISLIAVLSYALAIAFGHLGLGYLHLASAGCLIIYNVFLSPTGGHLSMSWLLLAIGCGAAGLIVDAASYPVVIPVAGPAALWLTLSLLTSSLVLGGALVTMVLGHWYLVAKQLSFAVLRNLTAVLIAAFALRILTVGMSALAQSEEWRTLWMEAGGGVGFLSSIGMFVGVRCLFGLLVPIVMSWMVWDCVRIRSNQSATGILYVIVVFVLTGELIAKHLLISNRLLL